MFVEQTISFASPRSSSITLIVRSWSWFFIGISTVWFQVGCFPPLSHIFDFQSQNWSYKCKRTYGSYLPNVSTSRLSFALPITTFNTPERFEISLNSFVFYFVTAGVVLVELATEGALDKDFFVACFFTGGDSFYSSTGCSMPSSISYPSASSGSFSGFSYILLIGITPALSLSFNVPVNTPPFFCVLNF